METVAMVRAAAKGAVEVQVAAKGGGSDGGGGNRCLARRKWGRRGRRFATRAVEWMAAMAVAEARATRRPQATIEDVPECFSGPRAR